MKRSKRLKSFTMDEKVNTISEIKEVLAERKYDYH
jgi:hypothetical protein